jgi:hypothetical protein
MRATLNGQVIAETDDVEVHRDNEYVAASATGLPSPEGAEDRG